MQLVDNPAYPTAYPSTNGPSTVADHLPAAAGAADIRGQDLLLAGVAGFDIRVYSPNAEVTIDAGTGLIATPSDPGYAGTGHATNSSEGAFVDLGFVGTGWFGGNMQQNAAWSGSTRVWCSWWPGYESDGVDQDGDGIVDEATNWVDDNTNSIVDDQSERETFPPYPQPLRGIQITVRSIEKTTGQIRQFQVESSFVPE